MRAGPIIALVLFLSAIANAEIVPVGRGDTDLTYVRLRELYLRGYVPAASALFAPFHCQEILALNDQSLPPDLMVLHGPLMLLTSECVTEVGSARFDGSVFLQGRADSGGRQEYLGAFPEVKYRLSHTVDLDLAYRVDGSLVDDPRYMGKRWGEFAGYAEVAAIGYTSAKLSLELGRQRVRWGIAQDGNSLMHSASAMPMDGLFLSYSLGRAASFHFTTAYLSPIAAPSDSARTENRYFSAHALRLSPLSWWDVVLKESVIYGGDGRRFEPAYLIPFIWYHAEQLNSNSDDNTFVGIESVIRIRNRFAAHAELLLDDFQIEKKSASDREPNSLGWVAGLDVFDFPLRVSTLELQYIHLGSRIYNQIAPRNVYVNQGYGIGHPLGPDCDKLEATYRHYFSELFIAEASIYVQREGQIELGDEWETPWLDDPGYSPRFPSGIVERRRGILVSLFVDKGGVFQSKLSLNMADIQNDMNVQGANRTDWSVAFEMICNFPSLTWRPGNE